MGAKAEATIPVRINEGPVRAGLRRIESEFKAMGSRLGSISGGLANLAHITDVATGAWNVASAAVRKYLDVLAEVDAVDKMALRIDVSAQFIDRMHFAAERSGGTVKQMDVAMTALARRAAAQPKLFEKWGISTKNANGQLRDTEGLLREVADVISKTESQARKLAIAQDVMSEAGRILVPMLQGGAEGLDALAEAADKAGVVMTSFERQAAAVVADRLGILETQSKRLGVAIGAALAPATEAFGRYLERSNAEMIKWIRSNRELVATGIVNTLVYLADEVIPAIAVGVRGLAAIWNGWRLIILGVQVTIETAFATMINQIAQIMRTMEELASAVAGPFAELFGSAAREVEHMAGAFKQGAADSAQAIVDVVEQTGAMDRAIANMGVGARDTLKGIADEARELAESLFLAGTAADTGAGGDAFLPGAGGPGKAGRTPLIKESNRRKGTIKAPPLEGFDAAEARIKAFADRVVDIYSNMAAGMQRLGHGLGKTLSAGIEAAVTQTGDALKAMRETLGSMLMSIGRMLIEQGTAALLMGILGSAVPGLGNPNGLWAGPMLIAGGAAVMGVGAAFKGGAEAPGGSSVPGVAGAGVAVPDTAGTQSSAPRQVAAGTQDPQQAGAVTVINNFNYPVANPRRVAREVGDMLNGRS